MYRFLEQVVADYMTRDVKTVARDVTMHGLARMFDGDDFNGYPVVENGRVVGLVTKLDVLGCFVLTPRHMVPHYDELMNQTVSTVMTPDFIYVRGETRLTRVLQLMVEHRIRSMPVIETDEHLVGVISRADVVRALRDCAPGSP